MIWQSTTLMTLVDLLIMGGVGYGFVIFIRHKSNQGTSTGPIGNAAILSGLVLIGLLYFADLLTMHLLPLFASESMAMAVMANLHLNYSWIVTPFGIGAIAFGFAASSRAAFNATERLRVSEDRYAVAVSGSHDGIWDRNLETNEDFLSPRWKEILGYADHELDNVFQTFTDALHPDDHDRVMAAVQAHLEDRAPYDQECRLRHKDGRYVWIRSKGQAIWDENGKPVRMAGSITDISKRKRAEAELMEKSTLLETTLENISQAFCVYDADNKLVAFNQKLNEMFDFPAGFLRPGMAHDDIIRFRVENGFYGEGDTEKVFKAALARTRNQAARTLERTLPDGTVYIYHREPMPDGGYCSTFTDITERKRAEEKLAKQSEIIETSLETMGHGICVYNAEGIVEASNSEFLRLGGLPPDYDPLGKSHEQLLRKRAESGIFGDSDIEAIIQERLKTDKGTTAQKIERSRADGTVFVYHRVPMPGGGFVATYTDITERKRAEEEIKKRGEQLSVITNNLPVLIAYVDSDMRYQFFNETGALWFACPQQDVIGKRPDQVLSEDLFKNFKPRIEKALRGESQNFEEKIVFPDGKTRHVEINYIPHAGDDGGTAGFFILILDLTEHHRAEEEIRQLNESLEEKVEKRTAELKSAQESLLRAERLAALGQLTGTVAHEIRNPLGAVSATAKTIELKNLEAGLDLGNMFARMDRGIQRCENIITELLDYARAKGLEVEPTPLNSWITLTLAEISIPQGITLHRKLDAKGLVLDLDRDRLRRVLINVVDNACQAMGDGDGDGELTVATVAGDGRAEITITDTGPGIPEDILPKIFEPLFSTKQFGVGLGLPTVRQIMEEHGGGFDIANRKSKSGKKSGTRATLWLPLAAPREDGQKTDQETENRARA